MRSVALVNAWGDLICPNCDVAIMTPAGAELHAGSGCCPRCRESFRLGEAAAAKANELARLSADRGWRRGAAE